MAAAVLEGEGIVDGDVAAEGAAAVGVDVGGGNGEEEREGERDEESCCGHC